MKYVEFVYKPSGVSEKKWKRWPVNIGDLTNDDAELLEELTDWTLLEWQERFFKMSIKAVRAFLFVNLSKTEPGLTFDTLKFKVSEFEFEDMDDGKSDADDKVAAAEADAEAAPEPDPKAA